MEYLPPNPVTRYGETLLHEGIEPLIFYDSPDGEFRFYINGGLAPFPGVTEGVILEDGIDGLHPTFTHLDHKGARQDGVSWADTVYDPGEMTLDVLCTARTPEGLRTVIRKWMASWDPESRGKLTWVTPDGGVWWCYPRLFRAPAGRMARTMARSKLQKFTWSIRNDDAFWQSYDSVGTFQMAYKSAFDDFSRDDVGTLGPNWQQTYTGPGAGVCETQSTGLIEPGRAVWTPNDPDTFFTGTQRVVIGPYKDFSTVGDGQEMSITFANTPEFTYGTGAANHIWLRMGREVDGSWDGNGVRAAIGWGYLRISVFVNFVETVLETDLFEFPPLIGEKFTFKALPGQRKFELRRGSLLVLDAEDTGAISALGSAYRGVGFGLQAGGAILTQATPGQIRQVECESLFDTFDYTTDTGLGENWPLLYQGSGEGYVRADGANAEWVDVALGRAVVNRWLGANEVQTVTVNGNPTSWTLIREGVPTSSMSYPTTAAAVKSALEGLPAIEPGDVEVTGSTGGPYEITYRGNFAGQQVPQLTAATIGGTNAYVTVATTSEGADATTATDNQIISVKIGDLFEFPTTDFSYIDIWGRLDDDDENPTGVRLRIGPFSAKLSAFNAGVETALRTKGLVLPTLWNQTWTLVCGTSGNTRRFIAQRDGWPVIDFKDDNEVTALGSDYRGAGFGMEAGDGVFTQRIPPSVLEWSMGDNATITQKGHVTVTNFGDQPVFPDLVVYGPGTFKFGDGPGTEPTVEFGPLEEGQVALIKTHPGQRGVTDLTYDHQEQDLTAFQEFIKRVSAFATNGNSTPLFNWFQSLFGIDPPQGNMYSLLKGRFSKPVPAMPVSGPSESYINVEIVDGNAFSKVVGAATPKKRWPE